MPMVVVTKGNVIGLALFFALVALASGLMTTVIIVIDLHSFAKPDLTLSRAERKRFYRTLTFGKRYDARPGYCQTCLRTSRVRPRFRSDAVREWRSHG